VLGWVTLFEKEWMWDFKSILTGISHFPANDVEDLFTQLSKEVSDLPRSTYECFEKRLKNLSYQQICSAASTIGS
jgi:hypothetical protein